MAASSKPKTRSRRNTKAALIQAAERLFAERGLGAVSARDIMREAGARNESALHYHFGDMEALIKEIFWGRYQAIEQSRLDYIEQLDQSEAGQSIQAIMYAATAPLFEACLSENGRLFAFFCVQLSADPRFDVDGLVGDYQMNSVSAIGKRLAAGLSELPKEVLATRLRQTYALSTFLMADYARQIEAGKAPPFEQATREAAASLAGFLQTMPSEQ